MASLTNFIGRSEAKDELRHICERIKIVKNEFQVAEEIVCKVIENTLLNKNQWWENAEFLKAIIDFLI